MLQCEECEHFIKGANGEVGFTCNPFGTIKEPECLVKWQLLRLSEISQKVERLTNAYEATLAFHQRIEPLQEKMIKHMERELREADEGDAWKYTDGEEADEQDETDEYGPGK